MVGVYFEIGLEAPSFLEMERVSWPLQTPDGDYTQARFVPGGRGEWLGCLIP